MWLDWMLSREFRQHLRSSMLGRVNFVFLINGVEIISNSRLGARMVAT